METTFADTRESYGTVAAMVGVEFIPTTEEIAKVIEFREQLIEIVRQKETKWKFSKPVYDKLVHSIDDDKLLLSFIRGKKLKTQKAIESIIAYTELRYHKHPDLYPSQVPDFVRYIFDRRIIDVLKHRDHLGRFIVIFSVDKWDSNAVSLEQIVCAGRYLIDFAMNVKEALIKGFVLVHDMKCATLGHATHYCVRAILKAANVFWTSYPLPLEGVYMVNAPFFAKPIYYLTEPALSKKLIERILITPGTDELHLKISPNILPTSLGGILSQEEALSLDFFQLPINVKTN